MSSFLKAVRKTLLVIVCVTGVVLMLVIGGAAVGTVQSNRAQAALEPFYTPPNPLPDVPAGTLLRSEQITDVQVPDADVWRVLYTTQLADGSPAVSGGLVFVPTVAAPNPDGTRPVVAWAHPTVGQGDACAPSRGDVLYDTRGWLNQMMRLGWLVTATDYAGLGTPGRSNYLVGQSEVNDLVNSIRAAKTVPGALPGRDWVAWGHSQGGHSALWAGHLGQQAAPELNLLGVAAAAPAGNLAEIVHAQWDTVIGWLIGPEVAQSWPYEYPELGDVLPSTLSESGSRSIAVIADDCLIEGAVMSAARDVKGQRFFDVDPTRDPVWMAAIEAQTPPPMPSDMPVFIAQGTEDQTVLPGPQALLQEQWCKAGSDVSFLWMGGVTHLLAPLVSGPAAVEWIGDRFAGRPTPPRSCDVPPPVKPSPVVE